MITLSEAENALKNIYLGTMSNLLNTTANPLLAKIEQTQADVYGNEIRTAVRWGINGGVGAGDEDGELPVASGNKYLQFTSTLKNLYGQISISDKAIRAGREGMGAFTDLLNAEITGLMEASKFNLARMLYGDGTGFLTNISAVTDGVLTVQDTNNLIEGMLVDVYSTSAGVDKVAAKIVSIDRTNKKVLFRLRLPSPSAIFTIRAAKTRKFPVSNRYSQPAAIFTACREAALLRFFRIPSLPPERLTT